MRRARVRVVGYLSIDAVQRNEAVSKQVPGGAALYAALGARHAGAAVAIEATVGEDYPQEWLNELEALGVDISGVQRGKGRTRSTMLQYSSDGSRSSLHHWEDNWWERTRALAPVPHTSLDQADVIVACPMPIDSLAVWLNQADLAKVPVVADTSEAFVRESAQCLLELVGRFAIFAPSCEETRMLLPLLDEDEAAVWLARNGARVLHKRGARGALAIEAQDSARRVICAPSATVVDATGAGDATVGALAARWAAGSEFLDAAEAALITGALTTSGLGPVALGLAIRAQLLCDEQR